MLQEKSNTRQSLFRPLLRLWLRLSIRYKLLFSVLAVFIIGVGAFAISLIAPVDDVVNTAAQQRLGLLSQLASQRLFIVLEHQVEGFTAISQNAAFVNYNTAISGGDESAISTALIDLQTYLSDAVQSDPATLPFIEFHYLDPTGRVIARAIGTLKGVTVDTQIDPGYLNRVLGLAQDRILFSF